MNATQPLLEIDELTSGFLDRRGDFVEVLHGISFDIGPREIVGLVGESGSGKSVTAKTILRLLPRTYRVTAGKLRFEDVDLLALAAEPMRKIRGRRIAYVSQEPMNALNPTARIGAQLNLILREHFERDRRSARERMMTVLRQMQIADPERIIESYPFQLSGGLRQRVVLAAAFLCEPTLLIADEPTTALDVTIQAEILQLIAERVKEAGLSVLFITHNMGVVWRICDRTFVMRYGRIVESGPTKAVLAHPSSAYTTALLNALPERNAARAPISVAAS